MTEQLIQQAISLGVGGLFFVMWWLERKDRLQVKDYSDDIKSMNNNLVENNREMIGVISKNTEAYVRNSVALDSILRLLENKDEK